MTWRAREKRAWKRLLDGHELTLSEKATLFIRSMRLWAKDGFRLTTRAIAERRLRICALHPECWVRRQPVKVRRCIRCGCTSAKQWIPSAHCPRGFW